MQNRCMILMGSDLRSNYLGCDVNTTLYEIVETIISLKFVKLSLAHAATKKGKKFGRAHVPEKQHKK